MGHWVFEPLKGASIRRDPNEAVLFKAEQAGEDDYAGNDALVREVLQNALDARFGDEPVRVRLAIHEPKDAPAPERLTHYFARLQPALTKGNAEATSAIGFDACRFLVCEDFGTRGLEGDPEQAEDPPVGSPDRQDFFWFWRNVGRSAKTGDDLGRWGLGKTVYRAVSRVGSMLGYTVRRSDRRRLLMGQSVLHLHKFEGKEFHPEGYWCGSENTRGLPLPIEDPGELEEFSREWHLSRRGEPGLSVVAPFVPAELNTHHLAQAVAVHFFVRILRGELVVEIVGQETGSVTLDANSLGDACSKMTWGGSKRTKRHIAPPLEFVRQCLASKVAFTSAVLAQVKLPVMDADSYAADELERMKHSYSAGALTSVRIRFHLPRLKGPGVEGHLDVHLQKTDDGSVCDAYFVREGMTITKLNSPAASRGGVRAFVNVDPGPLAKLLGDTEGPAHEDWETTATRPDREWKTWKGRVKFINGIVDRLIEVLSPTVAKADPDHLKQFFSVEKPGHRMPQFGKGSGNKKPILPPIITSPPTWYAISQRAGGFSIVRRNEVPIPDDAVLKVSVGYDLPRGDPIDNWSPFDFKIGNKIGDLVPNGKMLKAGSSAGNVLMLTNIREGFSFSIDGFDKHRDLYVRADDISGEQEESK